MSVMKFEKVDHLSLPVNVINAIVMKLIFVPERHDSKNSIELMGRFLLLMYAHYAGP